MASPKQDDAEAIEESMDAYARRVAELVDQARHLFAGRHPAIIGGALADLASLWLAGHPEHAHERLLALHVASIKALVPESMAHLATLVGDAEPAGPHTKH